MRAPASRRLFWDGSLARRLFILQLALIVALCLAFSVVIYSRSVTASYEATSDRVLAIA